MKVKFYGVRGSIPVCNKEYQRYGGNTTCLCITREDVNRKFIVDAGTGIRNLGKDLMSSAFSQEKINITFTHFHWDHIQGFPFFAPAYNANQQIGIHLMGKDRQMTNLREIFSMQMHPEYFPIPMDAMGAHFEFRNLGDRETFYGAQVTAIPQMHKYYGGSYGLRVDDESGSLVICTDIEHLDNQIDPNIVSLARNADLLIHDGQYTDDEYEKYKGWGHSTWRQAIEVARQANVKKLIITHHDPDHDDAFLDEIETACQREFPDVILAKEGMEISV